MYDCPKSKIMKKIWYIITILIISALLINVISADTGTYYINTNKYGLKIIDTQNTGTTSVKEMYIYANSENVRLTCIKDGNYWRFYAISLSNNYTAYLLQERNDGRETEIPMTVNNTATLNGNTYYYVGLYSTDAQNNIFYMNTNPKVSGLNGYEQSAYYYTFGDGALEPTPTYGELIINYAQDIRTTGNGSDNMDLITWNAYRDTAGNNLDGKNIEIQAIAGYFEGSSYADLKTSLFSDWQASTHPAVTMYKGDIEQSHQEYTWEEVAYNFRSLNTLGTWFWNIFADNDTWYQYGWRYQARLLDEELEPLTEWQTLYTGNSYTPSATETFTDDEPLTPDDVETINDINEQNGTTNNWYINNTVINNNEYNQTWQQNIIENIYNILQGTPDPVEQQHATDVQNTIDNAIDQEDNYINDLETQLHDLQLPDISENNGLMMALRWVREVHHETIEETQLGTVILVTMIIGLITYLIGRRNG